MIAAVDVAWADRVRKRLWEQDHILIRPLGRSVYLMLPLIVDEALIRATVQSLRNAIAAG
jgi:adenosylmethionine-8-amino-7-oxononanoate aminotransferase